MRRRSRTTPQYPLTDVETGDVNIFDKGLKVPWSQSWQVGVQRAIGAQMAVEVRYVGTRSGDLLERRSTTTKSTSTRTAS